MELFLNRVFTPKNCCNIDELLVCGKYIVFIKNSIKGSKITAYNIDLGNSKSILMKNQICFNSYTDNINVVFETSGIKRGVVILDVCTMTTKIIDNLGMEFFLGGINKGKLILRCGYNIFLYDINTGAKKILASSHNIFGTPAIEEDICAWLIYFKDKFCIVIYDISKDINILFTPIGFISKMFILQDTIVYQSCVANKCFIYAYNVQKRELRKCIETMNWIDIYKGQNGLYAWTERKCRNNVYIFDMFIYKIYNQKKKKVLEDYNSTIVPVISNNVIFLIESGAIRDELYMTKIDL